jgi:hypothetical protein
LIGEESEERKRESGRYISPTLQQLTTSKTTEEVLPTVDKRSSVDKVLFLEDEEQEDMIQADVRGSDPNPSQPVMLSI